ncbi:MAG: LuxR family transcriptional regulator [Jatrophihabitantaceae bacterium]
MVKPVRDVAGALERAAATAPDAASLHAAVVEHVQRLVNCGPVFLATVDPTTLNFTSSFRSGIDEEVAGAFLANEIGVDDVVKFRHLARSRQPVASLYRATEGKPQDSARWRDVIEPLGWGDELRVALRARDRTWGVLCLHRAADDSPYGTRELATLSAVGPALAEAMRRTALHAESAGAPPETGVIVLDEDFVVTSTTGAAVEWLELLGGSPQCLPIMLTSLAVQAVSAERPELVCAATADDRWICARASRLHGTGPERVVIVVESAHPADALPVLAAAVHLSPREQEVAQAVLGGASVRVISRQLGLGERTVQDHLKAIYAKTGVRSRGELVARLLSR